MLIFHPSTESLLYPQGVATLLTPLQEVSGEGTIDNY